jgi:hypothetical protein
MSRQVLDYKMKKVIIKYSVIISLFTFTLSKFFKRAIDQVVDVFLSPLLTVDINQDGQPDIHQLSKWNIKIGNAELKIGQLIFAIIKLVLQILVVYLILSFILKYTSLIKL